MCLRLHFAHQKVLKLPDGQFMLCVKIEIDAFLQKFTLKSEKHMLNYAMKAISQTILNFKNKNRVTDHF